MTLTKPVEAEDRIDQSANCHLLSAPINNGVTRFVSEPGIRRSLSLPERTADPLLGLQGIPNYSNAIAEAMELVGTALSRVQWHPRAVSVFSEVITLGMLSRAYYGESSLTLEQVAQFMGSFALILNSFVIDRH